MAERVLVDGRWADSVPATDRGLAYGDGVFRTIRVAAGVALNWPAHMERLRFDCNALALPMPEVHVLAAEAARLFERGQDGVLKIIVTRGSGGRGYTPPEPVSGRRILSAHALPAHARHAPVPLSLERSSIVLASQPRLAGIKHLNRLEQVLAREACRRRDLADAWLMDNNGCIVSTTMRNLFFRDGDGQWITPAITRAGIIGATRESLRAALGMRGERIAVRDVRVEELPRFTAAIACNSVGGLVPVTAFEQQYLVDSPAAVEIARSAYEQHVGSPAASNGCNSQ